MAVEFSDKLLIITGPTATGKTGRAVDVARALNGEIVSTDSRQVYRDMDLGTGKDLDEYGDVPYHMIDIVDAGYKYNLYEYLRDARVAIDDIRQRGRVPVVCGGTGLYVESLAKGVVLPEVPANPELRRQLEGKSLAELTDILASMKKLHNTTDVDTVKRAVRAIEIETFYLDNPSAAKAARPGTQPDQSDISDQSDKSDKSDRSDQSDKSDQSGCKPVIVCIDIPVEERRARITRRLKTRLSDGMVDEVKALLDSGISPDDLIYYGLEYKFVTLYLTGQLTYDEMFRQLEIAIHQFAKRQMTWFRGMERRGFTLHMLPYDLDRQTFVSRVLDLLKS